jgi:hypothetical protein
VKAKDYAGNVGNYGTLLIAIRANPNPPPCCANAPPSDSVKAHYWEKGAASLERELSNHFSNDVVTNKVYGNLAMNTYLPSDQISMTISDHAIPVSIAFLIIYLFIVISPLVLCIERRRSRE